MLMINLARAPTNLAFEIYARFRSGSRAGELVLLQTVSFPQGSQGNFGIGSQSSDWNADSVDIVLRSSLQAAEEDPAFDWIWTGPDLIYEDIKVQHPPR